MKLPAISVDALRSFNLIITWLWVLTFTVGMGVSGWAANEAWTDYRAVLYGDESYSESICLYVKGRWRRQVGSFLTMFFFWSAGAIAVVQRVIRNRMSVEGMLWMGLIILLLLVLGGVTFTFKTVYDRYNGIQTMRAETRERRARNRRETDGPQPSGEEFPRNT